MSIGVIMAGGSGKRFWPASRQGNPKQFLKAPGSERSLIQSTADRLKKVADHIVVVTGEKHRDTVREHLPEAEIICEPCARNTAPCLILAATEILATHGDVPLCIFPADHDISRDELLVETLAEATGFSKNHDVLIALGIKPVRAETGYGYIRCGDKINDSCSKIHSFVEKPDEATAKKYFESGEYLWNSGMFVWRPSVLLKEVQSCGSVYADKLAGFKNCDQAFFESLPSEAIDTDVMERSGNCVVFPLDEIGWSDIGSWDVWADYNLPNENVVQVGARNCVVSDSGKVVALVDVEDLIVVDSPDGLLICRRGSSQKVKNVVEMLENQKKFEVL